MEKRKYFSDAFFSSEYNKSMQKRLFWLCAGHSFREYDYILSKPFASFLSGAEYLILNDLLHKTGFKHD